MAMDPINLYDFEAQAEMVLPEPIWDFIHGGACDEMIATRRNRAALDAISLRPRFLVDVSKRDASTTVLGQRIGFPVMIAPAGNQGIAHPDAELATAKAAGEAGTVMVLSTASSFSMEEVAGVATGPLWFQLYHWRYDLTEMLVTCAEKAGYSAVCLTVDTPVPALRERDVRNRYVRPRSVQLGNLVGEQGLVGLVQGTDELYTWVPPQDVPPLTWDELVWLRSLSSLPLVIKGIRTAEDARMCVEHGVDGILVSNHGGRQVDGTLSSIETLPEIVEAVGERTEIYLDGGIRRGADVLRALALGARAVLIGRPLFWGLAVDGESGVRKVLELLQQEFDRSMAYCGVTAVDGINRGHVSIPDEAGWVRM